MGTSEPLPLMTKPVSVGAGEVGKWKGGWRPEKLVVSVDGSEFALGSLLD
jgi:hypothetical protein